MAGDKKPSPIRDANPNLRSVFPRLALNRFFFSQAAIPADLESIRYSRGKVRTREDPGCPNRHARVNRNQSLEFAVHIGHPCNADFPIFNKIPGSGMSMSG